MCTGFSNNPDIFRYTPFLPLMRRTTSLRIPWAYSLTSTASLGLSKRADSPNAAMSHQSRQMTPIASNDTFLDRALEKSPKHTDMSDEILTMMDRAKQAYQLLADVNRDIETLHQEFPKPIS